MLIGFIGAPCTGKTTTAARLFAELKELGFPAEFVAERARRYIAKRRKAWATGTPSGFVPDLSDVDQILIADDQQIEEDIMNEKGMLCVTDSCAVNAILYMANKPETEANIEWFKRKAERYDVVFVCGALSSYRVADKCDPNRVHTLDESQVLADKIDSVVLPYFTDKQIVRLFGNPQQCAQTALAETLNRFTVGC
jgi:hypothetical protein